MTTPRHLKARFTHRHRRRRGVVLAIVLILAAFAGVGFYLTRPQRLAAFTSDLLEAMYRGTEAEIESATFTMSGMIELRGLRLRVPVLPGKAGDLFEAEQALLRIDPWALLTGKVELLQMIVVRPTLSLTEIAPERFNFDVLRELNKSAPSDKPMPQLPRVILQEGVVRYGDLLAGQYREVGHLDLAGRLDPEAVTPSLYSFELYEYQAGKPSSATGAQLRGRFNPEDLTIHAELSDFALANPHRNMLPRQIRRWWDEFEPSGAISSIRLSYDERTGPKARVQVDHVAITIPQLRSDEYKARMTDVTGAFFFDGDTVRVESLVGQIEGLHYRIDGEIQGYSADAPFTLFLQTRPFRVPEEPTYRLALPTEVQKIFKMLTPVGWMGVSVTARREAAGGKIDFQGKANILSGRELVAELRRGGEPGPLDPADPRFVSRGKYAKFPYEVSNVRGLISFNSDAVEVRNLVGDTAGGGKLTITGTIAPPNADAHVDLTITGVGIPFDQALYDAMKDKHREATLMFFDQPSWESLHAAGHFITSAERAELGDAQTRLLEQIAVAERADPAATEPLRKELDDAARRAQKPVFDLGGSCNALVRVKGPTGPGQRPDIDATLDLTRANVVFEHFKYPVRVTRGKLIFAGRQAEFKDIQIEGLHGGRGVIVGKADLPDKARGEKLVPRIGFHVQGFPIDDLLFDVLGEPQGPWLRDLWITGKLEAEGTVFRDMEADRIDADLTALVTNGSIAPGTGRYTLEDLQGHLTLSLRSLAIETLTGTRGDSRVELTGEADWSDRKRPVLRLHADATAMRFEDPVLDLVGPAHRGESADSGEARDTHSSAAERLWAERQPTGVFDAAADLEMIGKDHRRFHVEVRPASLSFLHEGQRIALTDTRGKVLIDPDAITVQGFTGAFDGGRIGVDGSYALTGSGGAGFAITAEGDRITPAALHLLPPRLAAMFTTMQLQGRYDLNIPSLKRNPAAEANTGALQLAGSLKLTDASGRLGVGITEFDGRLDIAAATRPGGDKPALDIGIHADRLRIADRPVTDMSLRLVSTKDAQALRIADLRGHCGGGLLGGEGLFTLDTGEFEVRLALANAELRRVSAPADQPPADAASTSAPDAAPDSALSGLLSASLDMQGSWKDPTRLRGRGSISVREGHLRSVPLAFGLLSVSHLSLPTSTPFDSARISYYMLHDRVVFESIVMAAPSIRLAGKGTMRLPDRGLDIALTTFNPKGLSLGPITGLIAKVRDQIVTIRITGTLDRPETRVRQLYGLTEAWKDVFGQPPPANAAGGQ